MPETLIQIPKLYGQAEKKIVLVARTSKTPAHLQVTLLSSLKDVTRLREGKLMPCGVAIPARSKSHCLERKGAENGELLVASAPTLRHRKPHPARGGPSSASSALQTSELDQDDWWSWF